MSLSFPSLARTLRPGRALHLLQNSVEACKARLPDRPILLEPRARFSERLPFEAAWPPLRVLPNTDQSRPFENLQVLGDRGLSDGEGLSELRDRSFAKREARQNRAARGIREREERVIEPT